MNQTSRPEPSSKRRDGRHPPPRKALAIISVSKTHLTFAFERGAEFHDSHGLLEGVGKKTRHVKLKCLDTLDQDALRDYIAQAIALDKG